MPGASLLGHPALRLLVRMKARGVLRSQVRRLKRPSGWLFALFGLVLLGLWLGSLTVSLLIHRERIYDTELERILTGIGILVLVAMTVIAAFSHRGLYLPKEEIELAFSAPISRSDLIRYRMGVNLLRSLVAGVLFGVGVARRMPVGMFAFSGVLLTLLTVPILGQAAALWLGDAENRLSRLSKRLPMRAIASILGAMVGLALLALLFPGNVLREKLGFSGELASLRQAFDASAVLRALLVPVQPWTNMITAPDAPTFFTWFAVCAAVWLAAWELTARIPVDFRETSLATSADLAKRIARMRRGGSGLAGALQSKPDAGWRVPWALGHGKFGAVAWLKLTTIARKARGAFVFSAAIVFLVTMAMSVAWHDDDASSALGGAAVLASFGTIYLCSGLRFDFRNDLDQMEQIKAWPVHPAATFLATILPQVLVVSLMLAAGILLRCAITGGFHPGIIGILAVQPLVALAWTAVDNAVFLYYPVRYAPGQEGALQHVGRSVLMSLLRLGLAAVAVVVAVVPGVAVGFAAESWLELGEPTAWALGAAVAWIGLAAMNTALVIVGGRMLTRFDVARDRG
ncbi:MAG TPA: putative ABC exporter domain-containing protein [Planctomycetota bacterium]|jgi:hypothetical protein|nr:putative ABC exporter domain-containing protein [Planctomycetota bacterium]